MKRSLEILNFAGVVILAALCAFQWRINRDTNLELRRAEIVLSEQASKIASHEKSISGQVADLDTFRSELAGAKTSEKELRAKLTELETANLQLTTVRDGLQSSIDDWRAAIASRDEQLRIAATNIQSLIQARDEAIQKHNDLARIHNQLLTARDRHPAQ